MPSGPEGGAELCGRAGATPARKPSCGAQERSDPGDQPRLHTTLRNPLDERATANGARVEGTPLGKDPPDKGTATDYGCCESQRSGDRHPGGVPAGQGEAAVKWPWTQEP